MEKILLSIFLLSAIVLGMTFVIALPVTTDGFVCPVLGGQAGQHGNSEVIVQPPAGFYSVIGPDVTVPIQATNLDGEGSPVGPFASPGDSNYSPIWG